MGLLNIFILFEDLFKDSWDSRFTHLACISFRSYLNNRM